jgi:hypothetical protein
MQEEQNTAVPPAIHNPPSATSRKSLKARTAARLLPDRIVEPLHRLHWRFVYRERWKDSPVLQWIRIPESLAVGESAAVEIEVKNPGAVPSDLDVSVEEPYGFGLDFHWTDPTSLHIEPGRSVRINGVVRALRSDRVNLGKPWTLSCLLSSQGKELARISAGVIVPDTSPGRVYYVLGNNYVGIQAASDADRVKQMIESHDVLNRLAERQGGHWTHFRAADQRYIVEQIAEREQTAEWQEILESFDRSIREGSRQHEYSPNLSRLCFGGKPSFITLTEDHSDLVTTEASGARARAILSNGLLASVDSRLPGSSGKGLKSNQIYFRKMDNAEAEVDNLSEISLAHLRAPELLMEESTLDQLNAWFDRRFLESDGPGAHVIVAMTGTSYSLESVKEKLDLHLQYVKSRYPNVRFATASEAVLEFIDYYTPTPRAAVTYPKAQSTNGEVLIYPIRILGQGIPISPSRPMKVTVRAPYVLGPEEIRSLTVLENGQPIASIELSEGGAPQIEFTARSRAGYQLVIETVRDWFVSLGLYQDASTSSEIKYEEAPEDEWPDLFGLARPRLLRTNRLKEDRITVGDSWDWHFPGDLFRLLINPIAGGGEPVGRRFHPYGYLSLASGLYAGIEGLKSCVRPHSAEIRWLRPLFGHSDFRLHTKVADIRDHIVTLETSFWDAGIKVSQSSITFCRDRHVY